MLKRFSTQICTRARSFLGFNSDPCSTTSPSESGQALLFVIVALTVALAVGVSTAFRTLSSVFRITTTDTSSRVLAAAEGGLEHFLAYSSVDLASYAGVCTSLDYDDYPEGADSPCVVDFAPVSTDNTEAHAVVKIEAFYGDPGGGICRDQAGTGRGGGNDHGFCLWEDCADRSSGYGLLL